MDKHFNFKNFILRSASRVGGKCLAIFTMIGLGVWCKRGELLMCLEWIENNPLIAAGGCIAFLIVILLIVYIHNETVRRKQIAELINSADQRSDGKENIKISLKGKEGSIERTKKEEPAEGANDHFKVINGGKSEHKERNVSSMNDLEK